MRIEQLLTRKPAGPSKGLATAGLSALALGATALGAAAIGALAVGRLVVGRLSIERAHFRALEIDELTVGKLHVVEDKEPISDGREHLDQALTPSRDRQPSAGGRPL